MLKRDILGEVTVHSKWSFRYQEYVDSKYGKTLMVEVLNLSASRWVKICVRMFQILTLAHYSFCKIWMVSIKANQWLMIMSRTISPQACMSDSNVAIFAGTQWLQVLLGLWTKKTKKARKLSSQLSFGLNGVNKIFHRKNG